MCGRRPAGLTVRVGLGHHALKEIRASHGRLGGEGSAKAGMVMGIVGTVLLVLGVVVLIVARRGGRASDPSGGSNV